MWEQGHNIIRPVRDVNAEFAAMDGELSYEEAQATLAEFFFHNPALMLDLLAGIKLFPMQELHIKAWAANDFCMAVWGRGLSKSWSVALFVLFWGLMNPKTRIVVVSFSFRSSRMILDQCFKFIQDGLEAGRKGKLTPNALFASNFPQDKNWGLVRGTDLWEWTFPNGTTIKCLPLGDGTKLRGNRADTLVVDEFAFLPEPIVGTILQPFLASQSNIAEQQALREIEDAKIAAGEMTEDQRTVLEDIKKVIFLSSASYQFEHMYKRYEEWIKNIQNDGSNPNNPKPTASYFVSRMSYEAAPAGLVNLKIVEDAKKTTSEDVFNREYCARFTKDSSGYYSAAKMQLCTLPDGEDSPTMELRGDKDAEYILAIDSSMSSAEDSDDFAMQVLKLVKRQSDGMRIPMLVHSYAVAGGALSDHTLYFYYLLTHFNIVYIATDASQGDSVEFLNSSIQSELFKRSKIKLSDIEADFKSDDLGAVPAQVKRSYNRAEGRIIHKQPFGSTWQRAANEYMQACIDHKRIVFASHIRGNGSAAASALNTNLSMLDSHISMRKDYGEAERSLTINDYIEIQDSLVDLTKTECAMIVVKSTELGSQQWVLPQALKRTTGPSRVRRDSYSALLLGVWATKVYLESFEAEDSSGAMPDLYYGLVG